MPDPALRQALATGDFIAAPGVYDLISALIADRMGFNALYVTGYGTVASSLGLPDAGLATYSEMLDRIARIVAMTKTPVIADADTGYGGLLNVRHTVRGYEKAGVTAIQLEDQEFPKKCGHTPHRRVIPTADMVRKIKVASDARSSADFLIIARTDARSGKGLDEAISRGRAYADAGADIVFVESPESEVEMAEIGRMIDKPLLANMVNGGRTPMLSADRLKQLGFAVAIFPAVGFLATAEALTRAYDDLRRHGTTTEAVPMFSFAEFNRLIGFEDVWEFERRYSETE
ncbi:MULTISPECIES: oxaloacetate decarboxylase [Bradyrhizobium]|jgi:2-methylisocitrate lyase-like PEP mutase family enzyme|uniref:Isocitrate lyase/PEP mutase family protein n=2 Tax=Bradyrhizobium TaxID=374 RepID=A0ABS5GFQ4_9BRAD|nr:MULTISPECIES: isocitrate lyase/PEP mutase family protein [Bradyrhizobium]MBR1140158.1 isocitrate lyase/PEP mutase family protein [Bradyrhizobium denitrificans]MDU0957830.1 isocitrate lyase/PEP mutase family protein [Bradyrhizobium sp.]MDU1496143.1 isocitrate lyase/PEP mutase family protein [Bradyrhizobium sp.]MDU1546294.1 isocitrate lyase/PEP mutase family protein [Bradyrhizobium sp.]MDU1806297.1 isocitrate lyase/PEP mutase family protein [Bradyrhizobium sp.]